MNVFVLGIGAFGLGIARELAAEGHQVVAVDLHEDNLKEIKDHVTLAVEGDATSRLLLEELGVSKSDAAVVAVGENFEASLIMTSHLQSMGVKKIYVRVFHEVQERLLDLMQVTRKIRVESMAAEYFSRELKNFSFLRHFGIDDKHAIVEILCPENLIGETLAGSQIRSKYQLNLLTVRRGEGQDAAVVEGLPKPDFVFEKGDQLILYGLQKSLEAFTKAVD